MFKSFILTGSLLAAIGLLSGCTPPEPTEFGMSQSQFQQLPTDQQSQVIDNYNQQQQAKTQEDTIISVANTAASAFSHN